MDYMLLSDTVVQVPLHFVLHLVLVAIGHPIAVGIYQYSNTYSHVVSN
jgi:hypothetical protein